MIMTSGLHRQLTQRLTPLISLFCVQPIAKSEITGNTGFYSSLKFSFLPIPEPKGLIKCSIPIWRSLDTVGYLFSAVHLQSL